MLGEGIYTILTRYAVPATACMDGCSGSLSLRSSSPLGLAFLRRQLDRPRALILARS